jgi:hypothetical protein
VAFSIVCNLNIVDCRCCTSLQLRSEYCKLLLCYVQVEQSCWHEYNHRNDGYECINLQTEFTSRTCDGTFVLLCSKLIHVMFYALDEKEKKWKLLSEPGL